MPLTKSRKNPGAKIVSDCWKPYSKIEENGYEQEEINHSENYVNKGIRSLHENKIEGHWNQMKASLPTHGR